MFVVNATAHTLVLMIVVYQFMEVNVANVAMAGPDQLTTLKQHKLTQL